MTLLSSTQSDLHVVLVEPEIHWNTGNAGRTCLAAGAQLHLVEPLGFSLEDRQLRRAGLDYWKSVEPRIWPSWRSLESQMSQFGQPHFMAPDASRTIWEADFSQPTILVFGAETRGLPDQLLRKYRQQTLKIPQSSKSVRSLNLSTCVGIAVFEALRQRSGAPSPTILEPS